MIKILRFWFPVGLYSGIIFYVSSQVGISSPVKVTNIDKLLHFTEYFIFGFLLSFALNHTWKCQSLKDLKIWTAIGTALFAASDEIHQFFVPGRTLDVVDFIFDILGGWAGTYAYLKFTHQGVKAKTNIN